MLQFEEVNRTKIYLENEKTVMDHGYTIQKDDSGDGLSAPKYRMRTFVDIIKLRSSKIYHIASPRARILGDGVVGFQGDKQVPGTGGRMLPLVCDRRPVCDTGMGGWYANASTTL